MGIDIRSISSRILEKLEEERKVSSGKAYLSKLRNSIGKPLSQSVEVWPFIFRYLPNDFSNELTFKNVMEESILITLQLYSLHQQGIEGNVNFSVDKMQEEIDKDKQTENKQKVIYNMGSALRNLRNGDDEVSVDRRFNTMITSNSFDEFVYHLRHLIKLLKAKSKETKINYSDLSNDLYWYLMGKDEITKLSWAREYYRENFKGEKENEQK